MNRILEDLELASENSSNRAILAKLRNSIGKPISQNVDVFKFIFGKLPESLLGRDDYISNSEKSILTTLQLYSIYRQGDTKYNSPVEKNKYKNIGNSLKQLRNDENNSSADRRFNAMITSETYEELIYHLRHLVKLLKSKSSEAYIDFGKLSMDLYYFLEGYSEDIKFNWSRDYYKIEFKGDDKNEE